MLWLWIAIEPQKRQIPALSISKGRNTFWQKVIFLASEGS
ncbi:hypothetical protein NARC_150064 [Candidatus Nitrosocosmicus arcticus]|uniref:Uncharacterized protein n=1 Tax=Candidatus Nitrosocosmicus arcticus TaxID=2035267 RepID=A0A557SS79_9ARCH|nr:hypothetical protein NARC_150064 [Candidatus Nitrosocosmicus arcticus]